MRGPSLAALAAARIRDAIITGELALGEALSEDRLATALGISRTPVREALTALQLQGLITAQPQRGSFVFDPTEAEVAELCEFRLIAETRAMWLAHTRDRIRLVEGLEAAQARMDAAIAAGDRIGSAAADAALHEALIANCGNQFLVQAYHLISGRISAVRARLLGPPDNQSRSVEEHREIIRAVAGGQLMQAETILAAHVMQMRPRYRTIVLAPRLAAEAGRAGGPRVRRAR
jgi:DNA-binding GntR family transcriptional regulator